jgi:hypothetical protein
MPMIAACFHLNISSSTGDIAELDGRNDDDCFQDHVVLSFPVARTAGPSNLMDTNQSEEARMAFFDYFLL